MKPEPAGTGAVRPDGAGLAFVMGLPRSGTTLLSVMLNRHPEVSVPPEPWLLLAAESFGQVPPRHGASAPLLGDAVAQFTRELDLDTALARFAADLYSQRAARDGARVVLDKTPRYYQILPFVRRTFPRAKTLVLLRNPLAVLSSFKTSWDFDIIQDGPAGRRRHLYYDLAIGARRLAEMIETGGPDRLVVRYEELVTEPARVLAEVQAFLGVDATVDPAQLDVSGGTANFQASVVGDRKIFATKGVHANSVGEWKTALRLDELQAGFDLLGAELLRRLGYGDAVDEALALGVRERGEEIVALNVAELEDELERRGRDGLRSSREATASHELLTAIDAAYAEPVALLQQQDRIAALNGEIGWLRNELDHRQVRLDEAAAEWQRLSSLVAALQDEKSELRRAYGELSARHDQTVAELAAAREELAALRRRNVELKQFLVNVSRSTIVGGYMRLRRWHLPPEDAVGDVAEAH